MGTDAEAAFYREIPTDGTAVLEMTYFYLGAVMWIFSSRKVAGGQ